MNGSYFSLRCLWTWGHKGGTSHSLLVEEGAALHHDSWEIFWYLPSCWAAGFQVRGMSWIFQPVQSKTIPLSPLYAEKRFLGKWVGRGCFSAYYLC